MAIEITSKADLRLIDDAAKKRGFEIVPGEKTSTTPALLDYPLSEAGAAERFISLRGEDVRYVHEWRCWICWNERRGVWQRDYEGRAQRWALESIRAARAACRANPSAAMATGMEPAKLEAALLRLEKARAISAILEIARVLPGITISASELDTDRYLLGVKNGTLDLKRGLLIAPRRGDFITMQARVEYHPDAKCSEWLSFLHRAMGRTPDATPEQKQAAAARVAFLQKALGLSLSGDVRDKVVFCLFGPKDSGKTTFLEVIKWILGDYATQLKIQSLLSNTNQSDGNTQSDLADLQGRRFVTTSEAEKSQQISESLIKYLTQGGETKIKAARKYENMVEFPALLKLWLDSNDPPHVKSFDRSTWERFKPIGFNYPVGPDEIDLSLPDKLKAEGPGILRWALEGFARWQSEGLGDTPDIEAAREEWKAKCDPLRPFLAECCELRPDDPDCWASASELFARYETWARDSGERFPLGRRHFADRLKALGCTDANKRRDASGKRFRTWEGVALVL